MSLDRLCKDATFDILSNSVGFFFTYFIMVSFDGVSNDVSFDKQLTFSSLADCVMMFPPTNCVMACRLTDCVRVCLLTECIIVCLSKDCVILCLLTNCVIVCSLSDV